MTRAKEMREMVLAIDANTAGDITVTGNVGIGGETAPGARVEIKGAGTTGQQLLWLSNSNGIEKIKFGLENTGAGQVTLIDGSNSANIYFSAHSSDNSYINAGNVGIGTTTPAANLHLHGDGDMIRLTSTNDGSGGSQIDMLHFSPTTANEDIMGLINMGGYYTGTTSAYFSSIRTIATDAGARHGRIEFLTRDDSTFSTKMTIDHLGNVGIGKTNPNTATNYKTLHIDGSVGSLIDMGASNLESRIVADTNGLGFQVTPGSHTYQNIRWKAGQISGATDSHMLLDSNGNVGIGHTDPSYAKLHVRNDTAGGNDNFILMLQNTTTVADSRSGIMFSTNSGQGAGRDGAAIQASNNGVDGRAHITFGNVINNTYEEKVRFTTDGNASIGAGGAPSERLQIGGNIRAGNTGATTSFDGGGNDRYIGVSSLSGGDAMFIAHASGYGVGYFGYEPTDDKLIIACDNGGGNNKIDFSLNAGTNANGATDNLTGVHGDPELRISSNAHMVHVRGDTADTGTTGGSKGLSIYTGGGTSCPIYFGSESNSAQKSMYMTGYWIYLRGHQNEGIRFVFSQGAGSAPRSDQYQFKYNSATRPTGNTTWDGFSDARAKENVQTLTNALDTIGQLRPVTFDWTNDYADRMNMFEMDTTDEHSYNHFSVKENGYDLDRKTAQIGFIAQEFETVFPKSITEQELELGDTTIQDFKTVNYDHLIPTLTKAIQELKAENDALRARLDAAGL